MNLLLIVAAIALLALVPGAVQRIADSNAEKESLASIAAANATGKKKPGWDKDQVRA